jgi:hypothetical protein
LYSFSLGDVKLLGRRQESLITVRNLSEIPTWTWSPVFKILRKLVDCVYWRLWGTHLDGPVNTALAPKLGMVILRNDVIVSASGQLLVVSNFWEWYRRYTPLLGLDPGGVRPIVVRILLVGFRVHGIAAKFGRLVGVKLWDG